MSALGAATTAEQQVQLAGEQAALRRVATLVARGAPPGDVLDAVAVEVARLLGVASAGLLRFDFEDTVTLLAGAGAGAGRFGDLIPAGTRLPLGGRNVASEIARTGRSAARRRSPAPRAPAPRWSCGSRSRAASSGREDRSARRARGGDRSTSARARAWRRCS